MFAYPFENPINSKQSGFRKAYRVGKLKYFSCMKNNKLKLTKLGKIEMHSITGGEDSGTVTCSCASCDCGTGSTIPEYCSSNNRSNNISGSYAWNNKEKKAVDLPSLP